MNKPVSIKPPVAVEVVKIGEELAIILPPDALAALGVAEGDRLEVIDGPAGLGLKKRDDVVDRQMETAREIMKERRAALRELAK